MGLPHNHRRGLLLAASSAVALGLVAIVAIDGRWRSLRPRCPPRAGARFSKP
jgi:hypothetical protein